MRVDGQLLQSAMSEYIISAGCGNYSRERIIQEVRDWGDRHTQASGFWSFECYWDIGRDLIILYSFGYEPKGTPIHRATFTFGHLHPKDDYTPESAFADYDRAMSIIE